MNITICSNTKGGVYAYTIHLVNGLASKGYNVTVYFLTKSVSSKELNTFNSNCYYLFNEGFTPNIRAIHKLLFKDKSDIIHINLAIFGPFAIFKKYVNKIPFIYTLHGIPEPWNIVPFFKKLKYTIEHLLFYYTSSHASATISISNYIKNKLKKIYDLNSELIYNCIDLNKFKLINKNLSRNTLEYAEKDFIILFVGKLSSVKDPFTLVRAVCKVLESRKNIQLILVGEGEQSDDLLYLINELGISNNVKLPGYLVGEDLILRYHAADLFILPSLNEGFGIVLLEAMASGLPIISSNSGACPEIIGSAGILFKQGDYIDLAEKILEVSQDQELITKLSKSGLNRVKTFSCDIIINEFGRLYEKVMKII